jgi:ABC-type bacteriocin/lantibiotic exporter with double-glycine peptidase domain
VINLATIEQKGNYDCGVASAAMVLKHFNVPTDYEHLMQICKTSKETGTRPEDLAEAIHSASDDVVATVHTRIPWNELIKLNKNVDTLVILDFWDETDGHYAVMVDVNDFYIVIADPTTGQYRLIKRETFETNWFDYEDNYIFNVRLGIICSNWAQSTVEVMDELGRPL